MPISGLNPNGLEYTGGPDSCQDSQVDCASNQICNFAMGQNWGHQCEDCPGTTYSACQSASYENSKSLDDCVDICTVPDLIVRADCHDEAKSTAFTNSFYAVGAFDGSVLYVGRNPDENGQWPVIYFNRDDLGWDLQVFQQQPQVGTQGSAIQPLHDSTEGEFIHLMLRVMIFYSLWATVLT